jgi:hypothetical protein
MNDLEKLELDKMISANNTVDHTEHIRNLKHSQKIKNNINSILDIKKNNKFLPYTELDKLCLQKNNFLFVHYPNIYTKLVKDEIDINILYQFVDRLKDIEDNKLTQHEASFEVGKLLKKIYIDSALKHANKLEGEKKVASLTPKKISWRQFKTKHL